MALPPDFPRSPYGPVIPFHDWFPSGEALRASSYEKLLPPLVGKIREEVYKWRQANYAGASVF
jgi:type III restriction enzyme